MTDTIQNNFAAIGTRIANARTRANLSQVDLSVHTGISEVVIREIEAGTYWSSGDGNIRDLIERIADVCNEDPNKLHGGSWDPATLSSLS